MDPTVRTLSEWSAATYPAELPAALAAAGRGDGKPARRTGPAVLRAAAATPVLDLLTGQLRPATVIAAYPAAVLVAVDPLPGPAGTDAVSRIVSVLAADGSGVPNGVRIGLPAQQLPFHGVRVGDAAFVGAGGVRLSGLEIRVVRAVRAQVPRVRCTPDAVARIADAAAAASTGVAQPPVDDLRAAVRDQNPAALRRAVRALVGLGSGSTPGGDDVLAGTLAGLHATGRDVLVHQVWVAAEAGLAGRTTVISADLLRLAAAGNACAEAIGVLRAATGADRTPASGSALDVALHRLLAVGHTSGADLATGLAIGLSAPHFGTHPQARLTIRPLSVGRL